jgi:hypothetical protein
MKKILLSFSICISNLLFAQNNVGIGTSTPHSSAALDVTSSSKGLLVPRMTTAQRNAIASPAKGLMVFDTNINGFVFYTGSNWSALTPAAAGNGVFALTNGSIHHTGNQDTVNFLFGKTAVPAPNEAITGSLLYFNKSKGSFLAGWPGDSDPNWGEEQIGRGSMSFGDANIISGNYTGAIGVNNEVSENGSVALGGNNRVSGLYAFAQGYANEVSGNYSSATGAMNVTKGVQSHSIGTRLIAKSPDLLVTGRFNDTTEMTSTTQLSANAPVFVVGNGTSLNNRRNALNVLHDGRVGIGINNPQAYVHIKNNSASSFANLTLEETDPGDYARLNFKNTNNNFNWTLAGNSGAGSPEQTSYFHIFKEGRGNVLSVSNDYSMYGGKSNSWTTAQAQFIFGESNYTGGYASVALGISNHSNGFGSMAMGYGTKSISRSTIALGEYNDTSNMTSRNTRIDSDPILVVGNGTANNARSNALTILKSGRIGIGTPIPQYLLHVRGNSAGGNGQVVVEESGDAADGSRISFRNTARPTNHWDLYGQTATAGSGAYFNIFYAGYGNVLQLTGHGIGFLDGNLVQTSDSRLKKDITPIRSSLAGLKQLNGYHYNWINPTKDSTVQTGLLAQEVEKTFPELVYTGADGNKAVNYTGLIPHLLEAVKALDEENKQLKERLTQLNNLEERIQQLEKK